MDDTDSRLAPGDRRMSRLSMGVLIVVGVVIASIGLWAAWRWAETSEKAKAAQQIQATLEDQAEAWNAGDLDRFMDTYADDLVFFAGGSILRGRDELIDRYRKKYQARDQEMGRLTFTELEVTPLSADAAIARGRWKVVMTTRTVDGLFTLQLRKLPDGWKIVHDHTSETPPPKLE